MATSTNRRARAIVLFGVLLFALVGRVPSAPKADAALHNLFPADEFGFPQGRFELDDALFVTMTSDLQGGVVCVVPASVTDPLSTDCVEPVWGEAKKYLGAGTLLGIPYKAPPLMAGKWRLLATPVPTEPGGDLYEQFEERFGLSRQNLKGYELSEPFEIVNCTGPCDTSVATSQLAPWKARAAFQKTSAQVENMKKAYELADYSKKVMDGFYTGMGFGLAWGLMSAAWAGLNFDYVIPSTVDIAKGIWKDLAATSAGMWEGIKNDPPDPNFATVADPVFPTVDHVGDDVLDAYSDTLMRVAAYGTASRIANERYLGAVDAGDHAAAQAQAQAASDFTSELVVQLKRQQLVERLMATQAWAAEPIISAPDGETDSLAYWDSMTAALETLTPADLSAEDRQNMRDQGLSDTEIDDAVARWSDPEFVDGAKSLDPTETMAQVLTASASGLDETISTYQSFAAWMSYNMVVEQAQVPVTPANRAPNSKFSGTKLTGTAPLTVTFTSAATDPDGDALDLAWDIAGTRHETNVDTVTHTFTKPGSYGVSLVATDPQGEWDQAIKWITVYPDGTDPGTTNQPPVAQFSPQIVDAAGPVTQTFKSTSFDPDGDSLTHTWYFGDGTTMTGESVTKTFPAGYIMSVLLVVSDGELTGQAAGEVTSRDPGNPPDPNQPPTASFTADPTSGTSPLQVTFTSTSSDPDGDPLTQTWYFGDGDTATGATATHTYSAAGTYTATLIVSDGTNSRSATRTIVVDATTPLHAAFGVGRGYDAAAAANGALILDTGVSAYPGYPVTGLNMPGGGPWLSATGDNSELQIIIRLAGDGTDLVDQLVLRGQNDGRTVKTFSVALSQASDPFSGYATVIDHATLARNGVDQSFPFVGQTARFLKLTMHDNYGNQSMRLDHLSMPTSGRSGGIVSLAVGSNAATIVSATTEYDTGTWAAANILTPDNKAWSSTAGQVTDQRIRVRLGGEGPQTISAVALRTANNSYAVRNFEVWASETGADGDWTSVADDTMAANATLQSFTLDTPISAKYLELRLNGTGGYLYLYELQAITAGGLNVADGRGVGAKVVDVSKEDNGAAENAIAPDLAGGTWGTTGGTAGQFLTVLLRGGDIATIDRVSLRSPSHRAKRVRIETSIDGVTFTTVANRTLLNTSDEQFIAFSATEARYVKLVVEEGYDANYLHLARFRVYATDRGAGTDVPFVDQSTGTAPAVSWHWDFGDGTTSTDQNPTHTFSGPGTYAISLTVTDANGNTDTTTGSYTVAGVPSLSLTTDAEEQADGTATTDEGTNVRLTARADDSAVAWQWDPPTLLPGGQAVDRASVLARFPDQGTYTIRYRSLSADWIWTPWQTKTFNVRNVTPTLDIGPDVSGYAGYPISPQVQTMSDPADTLTCRWDWGDGTPVQTVSPCYYLYQANPPHTYAAAGLSTATLTVDDGDGGVVTDSIRIEAVHNPVILQVTDTSATATDLEATVRLLDGLTAQPLAGSQVSVGADGATPVSVTVDADGFGTVTLAGASGATSLDVAYGGTTRYEAVAYTRPVRVPRADIVFIVDESASMGRYQRAVQANLQTVIAGLSSHLDFRIATVGFASGFRLGFADVRAPFTGDVPEAYAGVKSLKGGSYNANGYEGIVVASGYRYDYATKTLIDDDQVGHLPGRASCAVLVTDATIGEANALVNSSNPAEAHADYAAAKAAMETRGTTLFSIATTDQASLDAYGPGPGLAGQTGGDAWSIDDFAADPTPVLEALTTKCVNKASVPDLSAALAGPTTPVAPGAEVTYTAKAVNEGAMDVPFVAMSVTLPEGVDYAFSAGGGSFDPVTRKVTWPLFDIAAGADVQRNVTTRVRAFDWDAGDHPLAATIDVAYNGSLGPEKDPDNNHASHVLTVHVPTDIGPEPSTTTSSTTTSSTTTSTSTTTLPPTTTSTTSTTLPPTTTTSSTTSTITASTTMPPTTTSTISTTLPDDSTTTTSTTTTTLPAPTTTDPADVRPHDTQAPPTTPAAPAAPTLPSIATPPPASTQAPTPQPAPNGELPRTGPEVPVANAGLLGLLLSILGAALIAATRRRRIHR